MRANRQSIDAGKITGGANVDLAKAIEYGKLYHTSIANYSTKGYAGLLKKALFD